MNKNSDLTEVPTIAAQIIATVAEKTLLFYGEMGVGKTSVCADFNLCPQHYFFSKLT